MIFYTCYSNGDTRDKRDTNGEEGDGMPTIMKIQFKNQQQWQKMATALDDMYEFLAIETYDLCSNETISLVQILDFKDHLKEVGETERTDDHQTDDNEKKNTEAHNSST